jgi:hypothetical protein
MQLRNMAAHLAVSEAIARVQHAGVVHPLDVAGLQDHLEVQLWVQRKGLHRPADSGQAFCGLPPVSDG